MRLIVKIGTNIIAGQSDSLNTRRMRSITGAIAELHDIGHQVVVVSSGSIAAGMKKMGLKSRPRDIMLKQAAAAAGQPSLMWMYDKYLNGFGKKVAQVLLTRDGLSDRKMYINSKNTLNTLLEHGLVPVVNENDTVATDEIRFGDNDQLAFLVAALLEADRLIILSDVDGLYDRDPKKYPKAKLMESVDEITPDMIDRAEKGGAGLGTGGMYSKLMAAKKAASSGITVNIINGHRPKLLVSLIKGKRHGTEFKPKPRKMVARKSWIAFGIRMKGTVTVDDGAVRAVTEMNRSLLPSGIIDVDGDFSVGDAVYCLSPSGERIAKGLANYGSSEIKQIMGKKTSQIEQVLGYRYSDEVIHRDNLVVLKSQ